MFWNIYCLLLVYKPVRALVGAIVGYQLVNERMLHFPTSQGKIANSVTANVEGMKVWYSINRVHAPSRTLMMNIPKILISQTVSAIKSVELVWDWEIRWATHTRRTKICDGNSIKW